MLGKGPREEVGLQDGINDTMETIVLSEDGALVCRVVDSLPWIQRA